MILVGLLLSGAGTALVVRAHNSVNRATPLSVDDRAPKPETAQITAAVGDAEGPTTAADASARYKTAARGTDAGSPVSVAAPAGAGKVTGAKPSAQGPAEAKVRQLARVWVYWDAVYPSAIKVKPGTVLLRVENQVGFDVNLVLTKLTGEGTGPVTTLGAQGKTLRNIQVVELGAGLYEYHDQSRPQIKGRLIVQP